MSAKRRSLKVILRAFDAQRPDAPKELRKRVKAGLKKFFGKSKEGERL